MNVEALTRNVCGDCRFRVRIIGPEERSFQFEDLTTGVCSNPKSVMENLIVFNNLTAIENFTARASATLYWRIPQRSFGCFEPR